MLIEKLGGLEDKWILRFAFEWVVLGVQPDLQTTIKNWSILQVAHLPIADPSTERPQQVNSDHLIGEYQSFFGNILKRS